MRQFKWIIFGILFAILWASASTATKFGLNVAQPLVIAQVRFAVAGVTMLVFAHLFLRQPLPSGRLWRHLSIYGLLNITVYLGCYVIAMQFVTAGIGALSIATNPIYISFLSVLFLKQKLRLTVLVALALGCFGVYYASLPFLRDTSVSTGGLLLLLFSMLSYSVGAIYFSSKKWDGISLLALNGWQTLLGGIFLFPVTAIFFRGSENNFNQLFWLSTLWLAFAVSIGAVQLWLWLLRANTIKAGLWLFLCPLFGILIAAWLLKEPLSMYTYVGLGAVVLGLLLTEKFPVRFRKKPASYEKKTSTD